MEIEAIKTGLRDYIVTQFSIPAGDVDFNDEVHLFDYGYIDSFGAVHLLNFVQTKFGINVGQADLIAYPMNSIGEIATFVSLRQQGQV